MAVRFAKYLQVDYTLDVVPTDPDDNRVLECALKAGSDTVVTGDTDLLVMGSFVPSALLRPSFRPQRLDRIDTGGAACGRGRPGSVLSCRLRVFRAKCQVFDSSQHWSR